MPGVVTLIGFPGNSIQALADWNVRRARPRRLSLWLDEGFSSPLVAQEKLWDCRTAEAFVAGLVRCQTKMRRQHFLSVLLLLQDFSRSQIR